MMDGWQSKGCSYGVEHEDGYLNLRLCRVPSELVWFSFLFSSQEATML